MMTARFQQTAVAWLVLTLLFSFILSAAGDIPFWASAAVVGLVFAIVLFVLGGWGSPSASDAEKEQESETDVEADID